MMVPFPAERFASLVPLLDQVPFNTWMARAVLQGLVAGEVWCDDPDRPASFYARHGYGMAFLVGSSDNPRFISSVLDRCSAPTRPEWLQAWPEVWNQRLRGLGPRAPREDRRLNFRWEGGHRPASDPGVAPVDPGVAPVDPGEVWSWEGTVVPRAFWASPEGFLRGGGGFGVRTDTLASIAFAAYGDGRVLEIGVETRAEYRGQGLARRATEALVGWCRDRTIEPVWSCRASNQASVALATSVGFRPTLELPYWILSG